MIKLQIIGNLGKDCIVKEINGKHVINFSVAHTERFKDSQGNQKERTTWVECAYWTDRTAIAPYLLKGTTVYAEGAPEADPYTNKEGQPAATLRMRVQNIQLLSSNRDQGSNQGNVSNAGLATAPVVKTEPVASTAPVDDLPF
ncbi:MAG: single-stranded DNA-binding protein [Ferruginibacter sp.]|nr:single-stranded DNA-binding protein [Bacteroidota bacterium]MBX2919678.1 single-stranded DNA-binding protein [Ferruginibacter sp.]MBX2933962.1 single-stranded DNA-binding protein [Ferruginibacter sp.]MCB0709452.1 single-stranded DNA-binding protein [Chitinophagaceae bacterium]